MRADIAASRSARPSRGLIGGRRANITIADIDLPGDDAQPNTQPHGQALAAAQAAVAQSGPVLPAVAAGPGPSIPVRPQLVTKPESEF